MNISTILSLYGIKLQPLPGGQDLFKYVVGGKTYVTDGPFWVAQKEAYDTLHAWLDQHDGNPYDNAADLYEE